MDFKYQDHGVGGFIKVKKGRTSRPREVNPSGLSNIQINPRIRIKTSEYVHKSALLAAFHCCGRRCDSSYCRRSYLRLHPNQFESRDFAAGCILHVPWIFRPLTVSCTMDPCPHYLCSERQTKYRRSVSEISFVPSERKDGWFL